MLEQFTSGIVINGFFKAVNSMVNSSLQVAVNFKSYLVLIVCMVIKAGYCQENVKQLVCCIHYIFSLWHFFLHIIEAEDHKVAQSAHECVQQRLNR